MARNRISKNELNDNLRQEIEKSASHVDEIATVDKLGHFKPDGVTIKVDGVTGVASASGNVSKEELDLKADKLLESRVNVVLTSTWKAPNFSGYNLMTYYKDGFGRVHLQGVIQKIASYGAAQFTTLPEGYRPKETVYLSCVTAINATPTTYGNSYIQIDNRGNCSAKDSGTDSYVLVAGSFRVD